MQVDAANQILNDMFAPWVNALGLRVDAMCCQGAALSMPITPEIARVGGIVSGQALAAMADTAMVFAVASHFKEFKLVATTNLDVQFLRPGSGEAIECRAAVVRAGKSVVFCRASMVALPSGKDVAQATATFMLPP